LLILDLGSFPFLDAAADAAPVSGAMGATVLVAIPA